jgi:hypothetical protein
MRAANAGMGITVGRPRTRPSVRVNSRFVTGCGATAFTGPLSASSSTACSSVLTTSVRLIQLIH